MSKRILTVRAVAATLLIFLAVVTTRAEERQLTFVVPQKKYGLHDAAGEIICGSDAKYTNLIRIPVSHVTAEKIAFGRDPSLKIDGWQSLKPYRIAFHRGYEVAENHTVGMDRHLTGDDENAFTMVENGRMDIASANRFFSTKIIEDHGLQNAVMLVPPVQWDPLYHYVHTKHRDLLGDVTRVLKVRKKIGEFVRILEQFGVRPLGG